MRPISDRPVHTTANPAQRKSSLGVSTGQLLKHFQHPILVDTPIWKVNFGVGPKLELPAQLRGRRVDACASRALQMVLTLLWVKNVNGFVNSLRPVLYERKQDAVFFFVIIEERAYMTRVAELGGGEKNWD